MPSIARTLLAASLLLSGAASAQTYSKTETITYHDNTAKWVLGQTATVTDVSTGLVQSSTTYDPATVLPLQTYAFGKLQSTMTYNADGTLATVKDGRNNTTTLSNWMRGIPQTIAYADGKSQSAVVDPATGWITQVTDELGSKTCYGYDAMGRLNKIEYPRNDTGACDTGEVDWKKLQRSFVPVAAAEYGIPAGHWRETVSTGNGTKITYYDAMWRPLLVREYDAGNVAATERFTKAAYDAEGRVSFASYPSTSSSPTTGVWTTYDALGRVTSVGQDTELNPSLQVTTTQYLTGFQTKVTNPRGFETLSTYLTYDQPTTDWPLTITAPEGAITTIARDVFGKPTSLTRSGGGVTPVVRTYAYNGNQELCRSEEPETGATLYGYDAAGNLDSSAAGLAIGTACGTANSRTVSRSYDTRNRLTNLTFPDGKGNQTWTYYNDGLPNQITTYNAVSNGEPVINAYTYNKRRLLTGESSSQPTWYSWGIGYGYDTNGNLSTQSYPTGLSVSYSPNALGQPTQVTSPGQNYATGVQYYPNGAIKQFTYGNGIVHTMTQNARQLPTRSTDQGGTGTALDHHYYYDANGNVSDIYDYAQGSNYNRHMSYDGLDRLVAAGSWAFGGDAWHRFTYDALDNLKSWKLAGVKDYATYTYSNNRLTSIQNTAGASVVGLTYDVQGNLANRNGQGYSFDYGNRLREVTGKEYYRYDGQGRRVLAWEPSNNSILSIYTQSGQLMYEENHRTAIAYEHIYFSGSVIASRERAFASGTPVLKFKHTDALFSPVAVTNASGAVIDRTDWEPFGAAIGKPAYQGIGYTGHVMDGATSLTYMQQRYYDPTIGRFLTVDPVAADPNSGANFNAYSYAGNNPYTFIDPDGRAFCTPWSPCGSGSFGDSLKPITGSGSASTAGSNFSLSTKGGSGALTNQTGKSDEKNYEPLYCEGSADCDFMYNQREFLAGRLSSEQFSSRTQAQGTGGTIGAVVGAGIWASPAILEALGGRLTAHGAMRLGSGATRGGSISRLGLIYLRLFGSRTLQANGARVYFSVADGRASFAIFNQAGRLITSGNGWKLNAVRKMAQRYGWEVMP